MLATRKVGEMRQRWFYGWSFVCGVSFMGCQWLLDAERYCMPSDADCSLGAEGDGGAAVNPAGNGSAGSQNGTGTQGGSGSGSGGAPGDDLAGGGGNVGGAPDLPVAAVIDPDAGSPDAGADSCGTSDCDDGACRVPFTHGTLQAALDDAACSEVLVSAGTYRENLYITRALTLAGVPGGVVIDGNRAGSVIVSEVASGAVVLRDLRVTNGLATLGAGILNTGTLRLENTQVDGNLALVDNAAGAGIHSSGPLTLVGSTVAENELLGIGTGAGIHASAALHISAGSEVSGNRLSAPAGDLQGAGVFVDGAELRIEDSRVSGNTVELASAPGSVEGGGLFVRGGAGLVIARSEISDNECQIESAQNSSPTRRGAGLALHAEGPSPVEVRLTEVSFSGNTLSAPGSGDLAGAAMFLTGNVQVVTARSSFTNNSAGPGVGGAVALNPDVGQSIDASFTNCTLSGNVAYAAGAVAASGSGSVALRFFNATIVNNRGGTGGSPGGISSGVLATVELSNSILFGNDDSQHPNCTGSGFTSNGYNLFGSLEGCPIEPLDTDIIALALELGPLATYGGRTLMHGIPADSAAYDAGNPFGCSDATGLLQVDQRGLTRHQGRCDIGAFEVQGTPPG